MKYLLDTHAFLWATGKSKLIPVNIAAAISDPGNEVFVSAVTFWEIAIKVRLGKLDIDPQRPSDLPAKAVEMGFIPFGLSPEEAATMGDLAENTHFDPFDRVLAWQAIRRKLVLISRDPEFERFRQDGLKLMWK